MLHKEIQKILYDYPNLEFITGIQFFNKYFQKKAPSLTANLVRENLWLEFYNSALSEQFEKEFEVYHKSKLVVGVENMPFKNFLKPLLGDVLINLGEQFQVGLLKITALFLIIILFPKKLPQ